MNIESLLINTSEFQLFQSMKELLINLLFYSRTSPALPVIFRFDDQLIEDTVGKLQPNQLTVDNLTVDWLRQRLNDLENSVKECQEKQNKLPTETNGKLSTPSSPLSSSPATHSLNLSGNNSTSNSMNGSSNSLKDIK